MQSLGRKCDGRQFNRVGANFAVVNTGAMKRYPTPERFQCKRDPAHIAEPVPETVHYHVEAMIEVAEFAVWPKKIPQFLAVAIAPRFSKAR